MEREVRTILYGRWFQIFGLVPIYADDEAEGGGWRVEYEEGEEGGRLEGLR